MTKPMLHEVQRLATSGARAVEPFEHDGSAYLAVPQLAADIAGQPPSMTGGDSDVDTLVYRWEAGRFVEHQRLAVPGGEDAEYFAIGDRRFLAVASLRAGRGPYRMDVESVLFELGDDGRFAPLQRFATFAAKQWRHFAIDGRHFLALAQGAVVPEAGGRNAPSCVFEWKGGRFEWLQDVPSAWGYNWLRFEAGGRPLLAYADHVQPSRLLAWNGASFEPFQDLPGASGRAFCAFEAGGESWLAFAALLGQTTLHRWTGGGFEPHRTLGGPGGRELTWIAGGEGGGTLVQINFIHGSREAPQPLLRSVLWAWRDAKGLEVAEEFNTSGGTDAAAFEVDGVMHLAVSNSLDGALRFRADSRIYRLTPR